MGGQEGSGQAIAWRGRWYTEPGKALSRMKGWGHIGPLEIICTRGAEMPGPIEKERKSHKDVKFSSTEEPASVATAAQ